MAYYTSGRHSDEAVVRNTRSTSNMGRTSIQERIGKESTGRNDSLALELIPVLHGSLGDEVPQILPRNRVGSTQLGASYPILRFLPFLFLLRLGLVFRADGGRGEAAGFFVQLDEDR